MKSYRLYLLIGAYIIVGCNNNGMHNRVTTYSSFPEVKELSPVQITLPEDTVFMRYPYRIAKTDSLFFIFDLHPLEYYMHCFSCPEFEYVGAFFKRGQGPDEYVSADNIQCVNDTLYFDSSRNIMSVVAVKSLQAGNPVIKKIKFPDEFGFLNRGVKIGKHFYFPIYLYNNAMEKSRILKFDNNGNFLSSFGKINASDTVDAPAYQGWNPFISGNERILAAATQLGEVIDIFSFENDAVVQHTVKGPGGEPVFQRSGNFAIPNGIMGFEDIVATNGRIYAVYCGQTMKEYYAQGNEAKKGGKFIYIYDYSGRPLKKIILDRWITGLYIDTNTSIVYMLDANSDQPLFTLPLSDFE
jgi:hypothetical protein